ncbi:MAG: type I restriction enzyme S subunit [Colwellia sp.]|jgi:type I restriction enzyme S subunit
MNSLIPEGWALGGLTDFSEINPKLKQQAVLTDALNVSFIKMEDVSNNAKILNKRIRKYSEVSKGFTKFNDHDVLVAKITPCFENGKGAYVEQLTNGIGFGSTEFHVLRAKSKADSRFLYHYTNFSSFRLDAEASMCGTGGQRRVQTDFLRTHKVVFPPLPEQQKIAKILTSVDEVIEKTQAQIDKLKDLKTGMMQELLTNGIGHTEFKDSPVGRIPAEWEVVELGEIGGVTKLAGFEYTNHFDYSIGGEIIAIRALNLTNGKLDLNKIQTIPKETSDMLPRSKLHKGDILITYVGVNIGEMGYIDEDDKYHLAPNVGKIFFDQDLIDSQFMFQQMLSEKVQASIKSFTSVTSQPSLNMANIRKIPVVIPSKSEQIMINYKFQSLDSIIDIKENKLKQTKFIKKALMQDLLTGKVRVKTESTNTEVAMG